MPAWTRRRAAFGLGLLGFAPGVSFSQTPFVLVMLGDSLTAGYGLAAKFAIPAQLEDVLRAQGYSVRVVNAGLSGDTSEGGLARLDFSVGANASGVLVALGGNDMLQGRPPSETRANIAAIVKNLKARKLRVALAGMRAAANFGAAQRQAFDAIFPAVAEAYRVKLYPFLLDGALGDARAMQADGIHPNAEGALIVARRLAPFVVEAFDLHRDHSGDRKRP